MQQTSMLWANHHRANAVDERGCLGVRAVFAEASQGYDWAGSSQREIAVALMHTGDWSAWLADALEMLSGSEAQRVQRKRIPADRDALALAYALHRLLLGEMLGLDPSDVPLGRDQRGCPRVAARIAYTSLSHADGLIAVAMTTSGPVGVDIEPAARSSAMLEIAHCVCHPSESAALVALDGTHRNTALLALWVRKEALLKAAGVGLAIPMDSFTASADQPLVQPIGGTVAYQVRMLEGGDQCVAAVAGPAGIDINCRWLRPVGGPRVADGGVLDMRKAGPTKRSR